MRGDALPSTYGALKREAFCVCKEILSATGVIVKRSIAAHCSSLSQNRFLLMNPSPNTNQYRIVEAKRLMSSDPSHSRSRSEPLLRFRYLLPNLPSGWESRLSSSLLLATDAPNAARPWQSRSPQVRPAAASATASRHNPVHVPNRRTHRSISVRHDRCDRASKTTATFESDPHSSLGYWRKRVVPWSFTSS
jgi:hypothetical protein